MKKSAILVLTGVLMLAFFMTNIGTASARRIINTSLPDPTATFVQGNPQFTAEVIPTVQLAGLDSLADGMLVPAGFPKGEKQFEGKALEISGLSKTTVNLCFPLKGTSSGWGGQVGYWDGTSWKLLATTITPAPESNLSWACTSGSANGQYAFIKWVADPSLLPKTAGKPACPFSVDALFMIGDALPDMGDGYITAQARKVLLFASEDLTGKTVSVKYISSSPAGTFLFDDQATNMFITSGTLQPYMGIFYAVDIPSGHIFKLKNLHEYTETYSLDFGDCIIVQTQGISA